jgi:hypothetical protein
MRTFITRITGSGFVKQGSITDGHPVEFRHWQEVVDEAEAALDFAVHSDEEESVVELWLEDPMSFQKAMGADGPQTGGAIRRADNFGGKVARRESNWDQEFSDAQAHVKNVLANLGNGR